MTVEPMTNAEIAEKLRGLNPTPGPWLYRPNEYDDWGVLRTPPDSEGRSWLIMQAKDPRFRSDECLSVHRKTGTDPWRDNAEFIALCLTHRDQIIASLEVQGGIEMAVRWLRDADDQAAEDLCDAIRVEVNRQRGLGCFIGQPYLDMFAAAIRKLADKQ